MGNSRVHVVLIIGEAGCGKSTFINNAVGRVVASVGHRLVSEEGRVEGYESQIGDSSVLLVDTPGFNDTYTDDVKILEKISDWFRRRHSDKMVLGGIVYLHDISESRFRAGGEASMSPIKFSTTLANHAAVYFTTSRQITREDFDTRVHDLKNNVLGQIVAQGLYVSENYAEILSLDDRIQAHVVIEKVLERSSKMAILDFGKELQVISGKVQSRPIVQGEPGILSYLFRPRQWFKRTKKQ